MTVGGEREIVDVLHGLELRVTERLVRVETQLQAWREANAEVERRVEELEKNCTLLGASAATDRAIAKDRSDRLLLGLVIVAFISGTDLIAKVASATGVIA